MMTTTYFASKIFKFIPNYNVQQYKQCVDIHLSFSVIQLLKPHCLKYLSLVFLFNPNQVLVFQHLNLLFQLFFFFL